MCVCGGKVATDPLRTYLLSDSSSSKRIGQLCLLLHHSQLTSYLYSKSRVWALGMVASGCYIQAPKHAVRNLDIWTIIWIFVQWMSSPHISSKVEIQIALSLHALVTFQVWIVARVLLVQEIWKHHWGFAYQCSNTNFRGFEAVLPLQDFAVGLGWLAAFSKHIHS